MVESFNMKLEKYIDHTNLKANATRVDIEKLCLEAKEFDFASVCVNPYWVSFAKELLTGTDVNVCTVIGFPLGATSTESKTDETIFAIQQGADEVDMVINIGLVKNKEYDKVTNDIKSVVNAAHKQDAIFGTKSIVKVILETCYLTDEEIVSSCKCCLNAGADFVKTSTGFGPEGATLKNVKLMKETVGDKCKIKAAGGIRDKETAIAMIDCGADRIGTSNGTKICEK